MPDEQKKLILVVENVQIVVVLVWKDITMEVVI